MLHRRPQELLIVSFTIRPRGSFALAESAGFASIDRATMPREPDLRLAFCRDDGLEVTAAHLTQSRPDEVVHVEGDARDRIQLERILGLDVDATTFADVGDRDPVVKVLQAAAPGLRPPVLPSAYEAAAWCILQARRPGAQARQMRHDLAEQAGSIVTVAGVDLPCLPPPHDLMEARAVKGMDATRLERLHGIARAALDGKLDTASLKALDPEEARAEIEKLVGIGPFSSAIVVGRGLGHTDALFGPITELNEQVGRLYGLGRAATAGELNDLASSWSPWRAWVQVYFRAVSSRLAQTSSVQEVADGRVEKSAGLTGAPSVTRASRTGERR